MAKVNECLAKVHEGLVNVNEGLTTLLDYLKTFKAHKLKTGQQLPKTSSV